MSHKTPYLVILIFFRYPSIPTSVVGGNFKFCGYINAEPKSTVDLIVVRVKKKLAKFGQKNFGFGTVIKGTQKITLQVPETPKEGSMIARFLGFFFLLSVFMKLSYQEDGGNAAK